jgi:hypothetical protein
MKRTIKQIESLGFKSNKHTGEYENDKMQIGIHSTIRRNEFICCFSYSDFSKSMQISHYANKIDGFQPALTRPKNKAISDAREYFNLI